jgi:hypothetical protein
VKAGPSLVGTHGRIAAARTWVLAAMATDTARAWTVDDLVPLVRRLYGATAQESEGALRQLVKARRVEVVVKGRACYPGSWRVAS